MFSSFRNWSCSARRQPRWRTSWSSTTKTMSISSPILSLTLNTSLDSVRISYMVFSAWWRMIIVKKSKKIFSLRLWLSRPRRPWDGCDNVSGRIVDRRRPAGGSAGACGPQLGGRLAPCSQGLCLRLLLRQRHCPRHPPPSGRLQAGHVCRPRRTPWRRGWRCLFLHRQSDDTLDPQDGNWVFPWHRSLHRHRLRERPVLQVNHFNTHKISKLRIKIFYSQHYSISCILVRIRGRNMMVGKHNVPFFPSFFLNLEILFCTKEFFP